MIQPLKFEYIDSFTVYQEGNRSSLLLPVDIVLLLQHGIDIPQEPPT
jgi:hypothetical protein